MSSRKGDRTFITSMRIDIRAVAELAFFYHRKGRVCSRNRVVNQALTDFCALLRSNGLSVEVPTVERSLEILRELYGDEAVGPRTASAIVSQLRLDASSDSESILAEAQRLMAAQFKEDEPTPTVPELPANLGDLVALEKKTDEVR